MQKDMFLVTPMSKQISLEAGEVYTGTIKIANPANATSDFSFTASISPYGVAGEDYSADLTTKSNRTMIADWITLENATGTLAPNESTNITYTITVPEDAPAGAQYSAIVISQDKKNADTPGMNVENIVEMASIIYADVAGETVHEGDILDNSIPGFSTTIPITLTARFDNHGNVHEEAAINITAKNVLTGEVYPATDDGHFSELILPETTRAVSRDVEGLPLLGIVHITQSIYYDGKTSTEEKDVIICPIWFMVLFAVAIASIIALISRIIYKHRQKKHRYDNII